MAAGVPIDFDGRSRGKLNCRNYNCLHGTLANQVGQQTPARSKRLKHDRMAEFGRSDESKRLRLSNPASWYGAVEPKFKVGPRL